MRSYGFGSCRRCFVSRNDLIFIIVSDEGGIKGMIQELKLEGKGKMETEVVG